MTDQEYSSGAEALQALVDSKRRAVELRACHQRVADIQRAIDEAIYLNDHRDRDALTAVDRFAASDPSSLGLRVSDGVLEKIAVNDATVSAVERDVVQVLTEMGWMQP